MLAKFKIDKLLTQINNLFCLNIIDLREQVI